MADLDRLLERTSRTFALSIPVLPEPTRREVTLAYLLFRIADTFEDAAGWPADRRIAALTAFAALVTASDAAAALPAEASELAVAWTTGPEASGHTGYLELLAATPEVLADFLTLDAPARAVIARYTVATAEGMAHYVAQSGPAGLALADLAALRHYCYVVAGLVGEMLTELFLLAEPRLEALAESLRSRSAAFGEALQLVNILRDAGGDVAEGRSFLPSGVAREEVFALARADLAVAGGYVNDLQAAGAPRGMIAFTALPVLLAGATLDLVEHEGAGAKLSREAVFTAADALEARLDSGTPAVPPS